MKIDIETTFPISRVNQNFSEAARMTENKGIITIMKNNKPKFVMMTFEKFKKYGEASEKMSIANKGN